MCPYESNSLYVISSGRYAVAQPMLQMLDYNAPYFAESKDLSGLVELSNSLVRRLYRSPTPNSAIFRLL